MVWPVVIVFVGVIAALALIAVVVRKHVPAEGILAWVRESFTTSKEDESDTSTKGRAEAKTGTIADLLKLSEEGPAYHQARDIRDQARELREQARDFRELVEHRRGAR